MPVNSELICQALAEGYVVELNYDGYFRCVEVHAVGMSKAGHLIARVWQVSGGSVSNEPSGWKLLRLDEASGATLTRDKSSAPRPGYKSGDKQMQRIICEL